MDIQAEKIEIMRMVLATENKSILESVRKLFTKEAKEDFWETLQQEQKDEIIKGVKEIEDGDTVDYEDFMKKHR